MPSKSEKQRRFMAAAAHNPEFAAKVGIPVKVAEEFNSADEALHDSRRNHVKHGYAKMKKGR